METSVQPAARRHWLQRQPAYAFAALLRNRASRRDSVNWLEDRTAQVTHESAEQKEVRL